MENTLKKFAENVKYYRKKAGLTQAQLAEKLGYEQSSIAKIEAGKVDVPQSKVVQMATVLDCSPWDLVPQEKSNTLEKLAIESVRYERLLPYIRELSGEDFEKVISRADELRTLARLARYAEKIKELKGD